MTEKKPFTPTRSCPHRWCKPLHLVPLPFCLVAISFEVWHNWVYLVMVAAGVVMAVWLPKIVHFRPRPRSTPATVKDVVQDLRESPSALDLEMEDARYEGTGWRVLEVRKGWARVAVGLDMCFLLLVGLMVVPMFSAPAETARNVESARLDYHMVIGLVLAAAFIGFTMYAHKKATQPRKPKRAWVPAFLRTSN